MDDPKQTTDAAAAPATPEAAVAAPASPPVEALPAEGGKSYVAAWFMSWLLGWLGIDRFYRGFIGLGIFKLLTLGGLGVWSYIDFLITGFGKPKDKSGHLLNGYNKHHKVIEIITAIIFGLNFLFVPALLVLVVFLAVPSLQSNARDTDRSNDVSAIKHAVQLFQQQNNYAAPKNINSIDTSNNQTLPAQECDSTGCTATEPTSTTGSVGICSSTICSPSDPTATLHFYWPRDVYLKPYAANLSVPDNKTVYIVTQANCSDPHAGIDSLGSQGKSYAVAILYAIENGTTNGVAQRCQQVSS